MAMPPALAAYWRNKRGHGTTKERRSSSSKALVRHVHHYPTHQRKHHRRRRHHGGGAALGVVSVVALAAALGYSQGNISAFADTLKKVPGVKTFGTPLVVGGIALGVNEFIYSNKWVRLLGVIGIAIGAYQLGGKGFDVSWVGDVADADGLVADVT